MGALPRACLRPKSSRDCSMSWGRQLGGFPECRRAFRPRYQARRRIRRYVAGSSLFTGLSCGLLWSRLMQTADEPLSNMNTTWRCELLAEFLRPSLPTRWNTKECKRWKTRARQRGRLGIGHLRRDLLSPRKLG